MAVVHLTIPELLARWEYSATKSARGTDQWEEDMRGALRALNRACKRSYSVSDALDWLGGGGLPTAVYPYLSGFSPYTPPACDVSVSAETLEKVSATVFFLTNTVSCFSTDNEQDYAALVFVGESLMRSLSSVDDHLSSLSEAVTAYGRLAPSPAICEQLAPVASRHGLFVGELVDSLLGRLAERPEVIDVLFETAAAQQTTAGAVLYEGCDPVCQVA